MASLLVTALLVVSCRTTGYDQAISSLDPTPASGDPTTWLNGGHQAVEVFLAAPITSYVAKVRDRANYGVHFVWTMTGEACGTPHVPWTQEGESVTWSHSGNPPDACSHDTTDHPVTVTLTATVTDGPNRGRSLICVVHGTETGAVPECR